MLAYCRVSVLLVTLFLSVSVSRSDAFVLSDGWNELTSTFNTGPSPRVFAASSGGAPVPPPFNPGSRGGVVVFGGASSSTSFVPVFNDVWVLNPLDASEDGRAWTEVPIIPSLPSPPPRCLSAAAVDLYGVLYIFGGFDGKNWFNDFWKLNLSVIQTPGQNVGWEEVQVHGSWPPPVCGHSMLWDVLFGLVMFGGGYDYKTLYNDLWVGSDDGWELRPPKNHTIPAVREFHNAVLNSDNLDLYLFGGYDYGYTYYNDTWQCYFGDIVSDPAWNQRALKGKAPPARANAAMISEGLDPLALILFGGRSDEGRVVFGDVWHFLSGENTWVLLDDGSNTTYGTAPSARFGMSYGVYDDGENIGILIFGGEDGTGRVLNDTWTFIV